LRPSRPRRPSWVPRRPRYVLVPLVHEAEPPSSIPCAAPSRVVAGRRRCYVAACQRSCVIRAVGSRSDGPGLTPLPLNPHASTAARSRSNGSRSSQPRVNRSNPADPGVFAKKPLRFPEFTKIPFHLRSFLTVQTFFFILAQNLFKSLQISRYTFPKP
jgi:hypothetical protein